MISKTITLHKGLDIPMTGVAIDNISETKDKIEKVAVCPPDFHGVIPRVKVAAGDHVEIGSPIFADKRNEKLLITSPVSGTVMAVNRGERRKLESVVIENDGKFSSLDFGINDGDTLSAAQVTELMDVSGISAYIRQRPYDIVPDTSVRPRDIFISMFCSMPLASDYTVTLRNRMDDFRTGAEALAKIAKVHIGISAEEEDPFPVENDSIEVNRFIGPNPVGNVGVQINHICPVNKGEIVWTINPWAVAVLGGILRSGKVDFTRTVAVAGSEVSGPSYCRTVPGADLASILGERIGKKEHLRIINGNPLVGKKTDISGFLSSSAYEVTVIPEGDDVNEFMGWIRIRGNEFSVSHSYFSWLKPKKKYDIDARIKGGKRNIIMSGEYDKVFPMDIYAGFLIKAIIARNIDRMEELGIYEVAPEDFAVAEFVDSSKLELQKTVREGLDYLRKELA